MSVSVPPLTLSNSAAFRSKTGRDSYLTGVKRASHDAPAPDVKAPTPRGGATSCFKGPATPRDSHVKQLSKRFVDATYNVKSDFDPKPSHTQGSAAFKGKTGRDSHIKGSHQVTSTEYAVPGMAEEIARKKSGYGLMRGGGQRDSYMRELKGRFGESSANVKGIGDEAVAKRSKTPQSAAFRGKPGGRDSYCREAMSRSFSPAPTVKGMADQVAERKTGKFLGGDGKRDSYLRQGQKQSTDAVYNVPGMAQKPGSIVATRSCFSSTADRYSYLRAQRNATTDTIYDVPGMADSLKSPRSPCSANASFKATSPRHSYTKSAKRCAPDVSYAVPGMAETILKSPKGKINQSKATERDSHIRAERKFVDASYNVPGMAELSGSFVLSANSSFSVSTPPRLSSRRPTTSR